MLTCLGLRKNYKSAIVAFLFEHDLSGHIFQIFQAEISFINK